MHNDEREENACGKGAEVEHDLISPISQHRDEKEHADEGGDGAEGGAKEAVAPDLAVAQLRLALCPPHNVFELHVFGGRVQQPGRFALELERCVGRKEEVRSVFRHIQRQQRGNGRRVHVDGDKVLVANKGEVGALGSGRLGEACSPVIVLVLACHGSVGLLLQALQLVFVVAPDLAHKHRNRGCRILSVSLGHHDRVDALLQRRCTDPRHTTGSMIMMMMVAPVFPSASSDLGLARRKPCHRREARLDVDTELPPKLQVRVLPDLDLLDQFGLRDGDEDAVVAGDQARVDGVSRPAGERRHHRRNRGNESPGLGHIVGEQGAVAG
eukprot:3933935-Rhodomonas_salina.2